MFAVLFEVNPHGEQWDTYLDLAKTLKPELESIDGFVDNIRYASLTRGGWILSLSSWRDEKALVRWRTRARHHGVQVQGRQQVLADYHLRVGQITQDTHVPEGYLLEEQRLDETQVGEATTVTLVANRCSPAWVRDTDPTDVAQHLGLDTAADGLKSWDVFDAVLTAGDVILGLSWQNHDAANHYATSNRCPNGARLRTVRVVRDYGMFDRRESPQYYPDPAAKP
jgi:heme-degrading monooxygenase HmoA